MSKLVILVVMALVSSALANVQDAPWQVESANVLSLPSGASTRVFPSRDGRSVAFQRTVRLNGHQDRYLCILDATAPAEPSCYETPEDLPTGFEPDPNSYFAPFSWSPDGRQIAVASQPLVSLMDTDLWLLDVASGEWTLLVDDDYAGALTASETNPAPPAGVSVFAQPAWSPDGARLAIERTLAGEAGVFAPSLLSLIDVGTGDIHDLAQLPGNTPDRVDAGSTSSLAWSPDGTTLAMSVLHHEPDREHDGVWLVDTQSGEMQRLVSVGDVETALQAIYAGVTLDTLGALAWSPDGTRLLLWAGNSSKKPVVAHPFWVELDKPEITPVPLPPHPRDTLERRNIRALQAAWSPDGTSLLAFAFGLLPDETVIPLDPQNDSVRGSVRLIHVASGTDRALGHLPLGPATALYVASWGADGDVELIQPFDAKI